MAAEPRPREPTGSAPVLLSQAADRPAEIGGKASSLVRLTAAGFRVPEAIVLPAGWFAPWWAELEATAAWARYQESEAPGAEHCTALKAAASRLAYPDAMGADLDRARRTVAAWGDGATCAVRSSSPDEDLEVASFAGGYVTVLGVPPAGLEDAVRDGFVSCLDERVVRYKEQHGLDALRPRIAVLVQRQLDSDVAGVGFSLNPVTNDFDEAVIDASFGLGETVVSGEVSPDHFVVDKPTQKILERRLGSKSVCRRLRPGGGVEVRDVEGADESSLGDQQVLELAEMLGQVEELFGHPVDVEWAYAGGELHLLQARPITTYFPLPAELQTAPGERRKLYWDANLSEKFTINGPVAMLTLDAADELAREGCRQIGIPYGDNEDPRDDVLFFAGFRVYVDYGKAFWQSTAEKQAASWRLRDALTSRTIEGVDFDRYRPPTPPKSASPGYNLRRTYGTFRAGVWRSLPAFFSVSWFKRHFRAAGERFEQAVRETPPDASVSELLALNRRLVKVFCEADLPALYPYLAATMMLAGMQRDAEAETRQLLDAMNRGYEGELAAEIGIEMFALTRLLAPEEFDDLAALEQKIEARALPRPFLDAWDAFIVRFGARGPLEADLRSPRYGDSPGLLLRQMSFMARARPEDDPGLAHATTIAERRQAFAELRSRSTGLRRFQLKLAHRWVEAYGGARDTLKHHWMMLGALMRRNVLALGARLVESGRLDAPEDVFHLRWAELEAAERDPGFDLRPPARERGEQLRRLEVQAKEFPSLIDSRGRILRPAAAPEGGDLVGLGISPGVARGPVKVLHDPHEKEVLPGDVLCAYTTDPGWTPLFVNAAAIVLQIGGITQHGGVVAREYRKPCVAGIQDVLTRFKDGQIVEVDGSTGAVRCIDPEDGLGDR